MRKILLIMGITLLIIFTLQNVGLAKLVIGTDNLEKGIVTVMTTKPITKKTKVRIIKGEEMVTYDLTKSNEEIPYALTFGNGNYEVRLYENISGNQYSLVDSKKMISLKLEDEKQRYIKLAKELTKDAKTDLEKVEIIYNYLTNNFTYDYTKIYKLDLSYKPELETLYDDKKGICYDYSAIFAGMLRSLGIPTKLVKGYSTADLNTYHAWNNVLVDGEWKVIDTTNDAYRIQKGIEVDMFKNNEDFIVSYEY